MLEEIISFIGRASGLKITLSTDEVEIHQLVDNRKIKLCKAHIEAVLRRQDQDGLDFLQVNMRENTKILITDKLIGFKPAEMPGLDLKKLPRVVTTPDLLSVLEAVEETMSAQDLNKKELEMLKKAYFAIVVGGEKVGFGLQNERNWMLRLFASNPSAIN
jgi:hypothetical protein